MITLDTTHFKITLYNTKAYQNICNIDRKRFTKKYIETPGAGIDPHGNMTTEEFLLVFENTMYSKWMQILVSFRHRFLFFTKHKSTRDLKPRAGSIFLIQKNSFFGFSKIYFLKYAKNLRLVHQIPA